MIWRTRNGLWFDQYGKWHWWFAWHPVLLESPDADQPNRLTRAWLSPVARLGVIVRGRRFWLYARPEDVALEHQPSQDELRWLAKRGEHLRAVR